MKPKQAEEKLRTSPRLRRELKTIKVMLGIYCRAHHSTSFSECRECMALLNYAKIRLSCCPFQENKPTCGNCRIHCYQKEKQERVKQVMRFAGPRMMLRHPFLALCHLLDGRRNPVFLKGRLSPTAEDKARSNAEKQG